LVAAEAALAALTFFQLLLSAGSRWPWALRTGLTVAGLAGLLILWTVPFPWPLALRIALMGLMAFSVMQLIQTPPTRDALDLPAALVRGVVFAAAIIAPTAWYAQGGLPRELARLENLLFVAVSVMAAILAPSERTVHAITNIGGAIGVHKSDKQAAAVLVVLLIIMAVAFYEGVTVQHAAQRPLFFASGLAASILALAIKFRVRYPRAARTLGESALLVPWMILPFVPIIVVGQGWGQSQ
jgi:hypothetical protein